MVTEPFAPVLLGPNIRSHDFTSTVLPFFFRLAKSLRSACCGYPAASAICATVAPSGRRSMPRNCSCLVPSRSLRGAPGSRAMRAGWRRRNETAADLPHDPGLRAALPDLEAAPAWARESDTSGPMLIQGSRYSAALVLLLTAASGRAELALLGFSWRGRRSIDVRREVLHRMPMPAKESYIQSGGIWGRRSGSTSSGMAASNVARLIRGCGAHRAVRGDPARCRGHGRLGRDPGCLSKEPAGTADSSVRSSPRVSGSADLVDLSSVSRARALTWNLVSQ